MLEKDIVKTMNALKISREEAIQLLEDDEKIEHGERMDFDLSPEKEKEAKKMANVKEHKRTKKVVRERKPDEEKQEIIAKIADFLKEIDGFDVEIIKNEREISLLVGENDYSITLTKHRPPKK